MNRAAAVAIDWRHQDETYQAREGSALLHVRHCLGLPRDPQGICADSLPFSADDATAGCENEFQAVVVGEKDAVDLPLMIAGSSYYSNLQRRAAAGDTSLRLVKALSQYMEENSDGVWENSWARFPMALMGRFARSVFELDLLADKRQASGPKRGDLKVFLFQEQGETSVRVPVSYLLKLSLAEAIGENGVHPVVRETGERCLSHFLSDNTSPETFSFYPVPVTQRFRMGEGLARETLKRFLLCQALAMFGNIRFGLLERGQEAMVYFSPHAPVKQKLLNDLLPDAFYRELFMSPCLSGWNCGEAKHQYMHLCHQVLSRSQLNAVAKLREANIITRNLVVLPNISNISLANNGTHISLGSRKLSALLADPSSGLNDGHEKLMGDLAIKISEHFLPLFVGAYSAAPYRLDFWDFHPEKALGFLSHELDFTHLRMIWRRWKKKANLKFFGHPVTPFGPEWLDRLISRILGLRGDFVVDFRLIDYLVALLSTEQNPALDGRLDNEDRLKKDLAHMGVFDARMSLYLLLRLRRFSAMGFSGFEGRHYSAFESIVHDMGQATNLQTLISALAYKYILNETVGHSHIPDTPFVESERRQVFFGTAIGIPTFFVRRDTPNRFMARILERVHGSRPSRRYPGYVRVHNVAYRKALIALLREDGADLIDALGLQETMADLENRISDPQWASAAGRLTKGILDTAGASSPMKISGHEFNTAAERYYRHSLRRRHIKEAYDVLFEDCRRLETQGASADPFLQEALRAILGDKSLAAFFARVSRNMVDVAKEERVLRDLIHLILLSIRSDQEAAEPSATRDRSHEHEDTPSVH